MAASLCRQLCTSKVSLRRRQVFFACGKSNLCKHVGTRTLVGRPENLLILLGFQLPLHGVPLRSDQNGSEVDALFDGFLPEENAEGLLEYGALVDVSADGVLDDDALRVLADLKRHRILRFRVQFPSLPPQRRRLLARVLVLLDDREAGVFVAQDVFD